MKMLKYLENALLRVGIDFLLLRKVEGFVNELVKKGEVASEDAKKLVDELIEKARTRRKPSESLLRKRFPRSRKRNPILSPGTN